MTVGTGETNTAGGGQPSLRLDQWAVDSVHLVVKPAGIAQIVACTIPSPQRGGHRSTVDTFPPLREIIEKLYIGVSGGSGSCPVLQVVQHRGVEVGGSPGGTHVLGHIGWVGAAVAGTEPPAVLISPIGGDGQGAAVGDLPGGGSADGGAGGEGKAGGHRLMRGPGVVG